MPRSQNRKRRADDDNEPPAESPEAETQRRQTINASDEEDYGGGGGGGGEATQGDSVQDMAKKLIRFALACEYQRKAIRRTDVAEKVLADGGGRQFKRVFFEAQVQLRSVFGMELVELPKTDRVTLQQKRAAQKAASQNKSTVTAWVLKSILPVEFRRPDIISPTAAPTKTEESIYTATYTLIVSLIGLSGGSLPDAKMERYLKRMQMDERTPVDGYEKTELLLKRMEKDGYIVKVKESTGTGEDDVYWLVGPRGKVEVGRDGATGLVKAVYGDQADEEAEEELDRKIQRSLAIEDGTSVEQMNAQQAERPKKRTKRRPNVEDDIEEENENGDDDDDDD